MKAQSEEEVCTDAVKTSIGERIIRKLGRKIVKNDTSATNLA